MSAIPVVYVSRSYIVPMVGRVSTVGNAERVADLVASAGCFPVVPYVSWVPRESFQSESWWTDATMAALQRCDAVVFLPNWMWSENSRKERKDCVTKKRRVFDVELIAGGYSLPNEFHAWVKEFGRRAAVKEGAES